MIPVLSAVNFVLINSVPSPIVKGLVEVETTDNLYCFPFFKLFRIPIIPTFVGIKNIKKATFVATDIENALMGFSAVFKEPFNEPLENFDADFPFIKEIVESDFPSDKEMIEKTIIEKSAAVAKDVYNAMEVFLKKGEIRNVSFDEAGNILSSWDFESLVKQEGERKPILMDFYHAVSVCEIVSRMKKDLIPVFIFYEREDAIVMVDKETPHSFLLLFDVLSDHSLNGKMPENIVVGGELFVPLYDKPYKARLRKALRELGIGGEVSFFNNGFMFTPKDVFTKLMEQQGEKND